MIRVNSTKVPFILSSLLLPTLPTLNMRNTPPTVLSEHESHSHSLELQQQRTAALSQATNIEDIKRLLEEGADPNVHCKGQRQILTDTVYRGDTRMLNHLLDAGADIEAEPYKGYPYSRALHAAVAKDNITMTRILLQRGAQVNVQPSHLIGGGTILHLATTNSNLKILTLLIEFGAFLDARDSYGQTALHSAVHLRGLNKKAPSYLSHQLAGEDKVQLLLAAGADPDAIDSDGYKADDYCPNTPAAKVIAAHREQAHALEAHCKIMEQELTVHGLR